GLRILRGGLDAAGEARSLPRFLMPLGELAACLGETGEVTEGLATAEEALARCKARDEGWDLPELLRIKGDLLLRQPADQAEACFDDAIVLARKQGALSWELRSALSFARLKATQKKAKDARRILASAYEKFTEGLETADLRAARALLETLPAR